MERGIRARLSPAEGRKFGLTVGVAFLVLTGIFWWRGHGLPMIVTASLAVGLLLGAVAIPGRLGPVHSAWMGLARLISKITTPIFMAIVYYVVFTPAGLVLRLFKGNPLSRRHRVSSTWTAREPGQRTDMRRQF